MHLQQRCMYTVEVPLWLWKIREWQREIVANEDDSAKYGWFAFPTNDEGTGRMSAYAKMCQFNAELSEEKLDAAMLFWDYYYSDESLAAHTAIEQPTALAGQSFRKLCACRRRFG